MVQGYVATKLGYDDPSTALCSQLPRLPIRLSALPGYPWRTYTQLAVIRASLAQVCICSSNPANTSAFLPCRLPQGLPLGHAQQARVPKDLSPIFSVW